MIIKDLCKLALLTQNFNFLKNCLYDSAQTFPDDSTILVNILWKSRTNETTNKQMRALSNSDNRQTRGGAFAQHVPCHQHTSWIRLPQTYNLTPRWPSYVQWFPRYPHFCLVVRQDRTLRTVHFFMYLPHIARPNGMYLCFPIPLLATLYWRRFTFTVCGRTV